MLIGGLVSTGCFSTRKDMKMMVALNLSERSRMDLVCSLGCIFGDHELLMIACGFEGGAS